MSRLLVHCASRVVLALLVLPLLLAESTSAQSPPVQFRRLSLEQGLSQSIVNDIIHDRTGFLWFATEEGINVYDGYRFRVLKNDPKDPTSLSYNQVIALHEDRSGGIWVSMFAGGVNRYDPVSGKFLRLRHDATDSSSISSDIILAIAEDAHGGIWVGGDRGLDHLSFDGSRVSVRRIISLNPTDARAIHAVIRALVVDRSERLWIGTAAGVYVASLSRFSPSASLPLALRRFAASTSVSNGLKNDNIRSLLEDRRGVLWVGTDNGLYRASVSGKGEQPTVRFTFVGVEGEPQHLPVQHQIYALAEDRDGYLWIGTNGGLDRFDRTSFVFEHFRNNPRDPFSLSYDEIRSIHEDRSGNIWIGTYGAGVSQLDRGRKRFTNLQPDPDNENSLRRPIVWAIEEDRDGDLWFGTHGGGLDRFDRRTGRFRHYTHNPRDTTSISDDIVRVVLEDRRGRLWLGTNGAGVCEFDRSTGRSRRFSHDARDPGSLKSDVVRTIFEDRQGILWVGTQGGGLDRLLRDDNGEPRSFEHHVHDPRDSTTISSDHVRWMLEDRDGVLWIATLGGGLNRFDRSTGRFEHLRARMGDSTALSTDYLMSIHEDRNGQIWIASWGGGIMRFSRDRRTVVHYTESHGLPSNSVYGFLEDAAGRLWLSCNNGLSRFDPELAVFRNYGVSDGLQSTEFNAGAFLKTRAGELFFGGINGVNAFYPEEIVDNTYVPPVVLTSVWRQNEELKFDRPVSDVRVVEMSPNDNVLAFQFAALDFTAPERNRYLYRLEGVDSRWIEADPAIRMAQYTTLPAGHYQFRVRASNNDNQWNDHGLTVDVVVHPAWYATTWFRVLGALAAVLVGFGGVRRRVRGARLTAELRAAHDAQMSIMPQEPLRSAACEVAGRCVPANEVGGDFFDYRWMDVDHEHCAVVVGDVSGKAMKAAMTAIMTSGAISAELMKFRSVESILTNVNPFVYEKTERQIFVAACLLMIDTRRRTMHFSNAGLVDPFMLRGGVVRKLKAIGSRHPLGLLRDTVYRAQKVVLRPGDVVVLVSDGVTEARNRSGEFYGEERLIAALERVDVAQRGSRAVIERIHEGISSFVDHSGQHDDMTVVVIAIT